MKIHKDKCHLLMYGDLSKDSILATMGSSTISDSTEGNLLGVS